jgi:hypothetical protein
MITVTVRYHNALRRRAAVERETISLPCGTSLHTALEQLAERHGSRLQGALPPIWSSSATGNCSAPTSTTTSWPAAMN